MGGRRIVVACVLVGCGSSHGHVGPPSDGPNLGACPLFPGNFIFNTPIDSLPADPSSSSYLTTIGGPQPQNLKIHLDLGTQTNQQAVDYYGIPYNTVSGATLPWTKFAYLSTDPGVSWDAASESDCADANHTIVSPCTLAMPFMPIPGSPVVEGGINSATNQMPYGDHHMLVVDEDACRLWEAYHAYSPSSGTWNLYGTFTWDLRSNALRTDTWTSADAAGFPIMPLLLRADEASTGTITHAMRVTFGNSKIRSTYLWPARHSANSGTSPLLPPMGQLFRLRADFTIPASFGTQSRAILQAMKTYGMYVADNGSNLYVQGEPSASWADSTFSEVQSVTFDKFEAVDITAITKRSGFDPNSGAVPP
jgi:hypothetical protein